MGNCSSEDAPRQQGRGGPMQPVAQQQQQQQHQQHQQHPGTRGHPRPPHVTPSGQWIPPQQQGPAPQIFWGNGTPYQRGANGTFLQIPMILVPRGPTAPPPQAPDVVEAKTITNQANLQKSTLHLMRRRRKGQGAVDEPLTGPSPSKKYKLAFEFDSTAATTVTVGVFCEERGLSKGRISLKPIHPRLTMTPFPPMEFAPGTGQKYLSEGHIDFSVYPSLPKKANVYMLVVQLSSIDETEPPSEAGPKPPARVSTKAAPSAVPRHDDKAHSSASSDEVSPASSREHGQQGRRHRQHQFTYCEVDLEKGTITASAQKIQIGGHVYEMEDIYGGSTEEEARLQSQGGSVAVGDLLALEDTAECSICLCEPCDTLIMPCRHRCLCSGCAELLRTQSNKCPICRTAITGLLKERSPNPSPSASPLASAAPPRDRLRL